MLTITPTTSDWMLDRRSSKQDLEAPQVDQTAAAPNQRKQHTTCPWLSVVALHPGCCNTNRTVSGDHWQSVNALMGIEKQTKLKMQWTHH